MLRNSNPELTKCDEKSAIGLNPNIINDWKTLWLVIDKHLIQAKLSNTNNVINSDTENQITENVLEQNFSQTKNMVNYFLQVEESLKKISEYNTLFCKQIINYKKEIDKLNEEIIDLKKTIEKLINK